MFAYLISSYPEKHVTFLTASFMDTMDHVKAQHIYSMTSRQGVQPNVKYHMSSSYSFIDFSLSWAFLRDRYCNLQQWPTAFTAFTGLGCVTWLELAVWLAFSTIL